MPVTLQQIANAAGVSRATVDRALKNRGRINPEVAEKIRKLAEEMGYVPNISGRALAFAKRNIQIGVILQFAETPFVMDMRKGLEQAKAHVEQFGCTLKVMRIYGADPKRAVAYMEEMLEDGVSAIALIPSDDDDLRREIHKCHEAGVKVVTFNSDIEGTERMCFVGQDSIKGGRTAAGIMGDILADGGQIAMLSGTKSAIHRNREKGFQETIEKYYPQLELVQITHSENRISTAANQAEELLMRYPDLKGMYISTEGTDEILRVVKEHRLQHKVRIIVQDINGWKTSSLQDGTVDYVITDDAFVQGQEPIMILFNYLYHHSEPEMEHKYTDIRIISRFSL